MCRSVCPLGPTFAYFERANGVHLMVLQGVAAGVSSPLVGLGALGGRLEVIPLEVMQHATDSLDQLIV